MEFEKKKLNEIDVPLQSKFAIKKPQTRPNFSHSQALITQAPRALIPKHILLGIGQVSMLNVVLCLDMDNIIDLFCKGGHVNRS